MSAVALALVIGGALLLYAGVTGESLVDAIRGVLRPSEPGASPGAAAGTGSGGQLL